MDEDGLPSFDYLKRFKRPKVENETIGTSSNSIKKPWDENRSNVVRPWNKEIESLKQAANKREKKQSQEVNESPSCSGVKKKTKRKAKTNNVENIVTKKKKINPLEQSGINPTSDKFSSTLTGENPETVDYKNLTQKQLEHLVRKLNIFYARNFQKQNKKVRKDNSRNLFSNKRSNASTTFGKGQVGKAHDRFRDLETLWNNYNSRFDYLSMQRQQKQMKKEFENDAWTLWNNYNSRFDYLSMQRQQKQMEKEFEDEALNALLLQIDIPNNQKLQENTVVADLVDLTSYNEPTTVDLTNTFNNSVICLDDSDEGNNDAAPRASALESNEIKYNEVIDKIIEDVKNENSSEMNDSIQIIQNDMDIENSSSSEEVFSISIEDSSNTLSELSEISLSEPSTSIQETSIKASNTTGESSSTGNTSNNRTELFNECPICFDDMATKRLGATKCGHVFCLECIQKSLQSKSKCPTCRKTVRKNSVIPLFN